MECKKCGHKLPDDAKFCMECGTPVEIDTLDETIEEETIQQVQTEEQTPIQEPVLENENEAVQEELVDEQASEENVEEEIPDIEPEEANVQWYFVKNNDSAGPFSQEEMIQFLTTGMIHLSTLVWKSGMEDWARLENTDLKHYAKKEQGSTEGQTAWYYIDGNDNQYGPLSTDEMIALLQGYQIYGNTFVWKNGMEDWTRLKETELASYIAQEPPGQQSHTKEETFSYSDRPLFIAERSIGISIFLSIITCGLYSLFWLYSIARDINACCENQNKPRGTEAGMVVLFGILTCGIYTIYYYWKASKTLSECQFANHYRPSDNSVINLVLGVLGLGIISMAIMQSTLNDISRYGR